MTLLEHAPTRTLPAEEAAPRARITPRPRRALPRRPRSAQRVRRALVAVCLLVIGAVHGANLAGWPRYFDDEGTYYSQAWAIHHLGALAPYTYWYDHPPVGWIQLAAFTWLPEQLVDSSQSALLSGRIVMVGYTMATALVLFALARRVQMRFAFALVAMLVWGLNPLVLFEGRQVFLDNVALPWLLGAFVLVLNRQRDLWRYMVAGLCFGIAVLSKETVLVVAPALVVALWQSAFRPIRAFALTGFSVMTVVVGAMYLLFAAVRSELLPGPDHVSVWDALMFQFADRAGSGFILDADSGAHQTLQSWLDQDPYLLYAGLCAGVVCLFRRQLRPVGLALALLVGMALRPDGYLPAMYVIAVLPFCALAVAGFADAAWNAATTWGRSWQDASTTVVVTAALLALLAPVLDWRYSYREAFGKELNAVHAAAVDAVDERVPEDATVVVDNTYWNDLVDRGWSRDTDGAVWFYKVDSDPLVRDELRADYESIDYLVWTYTMRDNAGPLVREAYDNSESIWVRGEGDDAVDVRRVLSRSEVAERQAEEEARALAKQRAEQQQLAETERARTAAASSFPGLTVGQVEALREERAAGVSEDRLARKYVVDVATVRRVVSAGGNGA